MIKTKIIFNTLLIILILYFIIEYFKPYMKVKNNKLDNMIKKVKKKIKEIKKIENDEDENIELDDDDEKVEVKEKFTNNSKNTEDLKPANFFNNNDNVPNFNSNVLNLQKYYDYNMMDGLDKLPESNYKEFDNSLEKKDEIIDTVSKQPLYLNKGSNGDTIINDYWQYKNEMPMCGGDFGNIVGYDNLDTGYAIYNNRDVMEKQNVNKVSDLRSGMGNPQKEAYKINMSMP